MSNAYNSLTAALRVMFRYGIRALIALIVAVVLWLPIGNALASRSERKVDEAWTRATGLSAEAIVDEFSRVQTNDTGLYIDEAGRRLDSAADRPSRLIEGLMYGYLSDQFRRPNDQIDEPPPKVKEYLAAHASELRDLYERVGKSDVPVWTFNPSRIPQPSGLYMKELVGLMAVDILNSIREDKPADALGKLEVCWKMSASLRNRPDTAGQFIYRMLAGTQMALLRKMQDVPDEWGARVAGHHFSEKALEGVQVGHYLLQRELTSSSSHSGLDTYLIFDPESLLLGLSFTPIGKPYLRLCVADGSWTELRLVTRLRSMGIYSADIKALRADDRRHSAWNLIDRHASPVGAWMNAVRYDVEAELTSRVLRMKQLRMSGGDWYRQLPSSESSRFGTWEYRPGPSGSVTVSLKEPPQWLNLLSGPGFTYTVEGGGAAR